MASNRKFVGILIQEAAHLDAFTAVSLLIREGEKKYPGISRAKILTWRYGTVSPTGKTWRDFMAEGIVPVRVLGGPLDEHPSPDFPDRKADGKSATSLVAEDLGIEKHPLYKNLIKLVTKSDLEGAGDDRALHLASLIKMMHRSCRDAQEFAFAAIDVIIDAQQRFLDALREIRDLEHCEVRQLRNGLKVLGICSANDQIGPAARYLGFAAVSQRRPGGFTLVLTNQKLVTAETATKIAVGIRHAELVARNLRQDAKDYLANLGDPGQMTLVPNWCYQVPGNNMLNGTETAPDVQPTAIDPFDLLDNIICKHVGVQIRTPAEEAVALADASQD